MFRFSCIVFLSTCTLLVHGNKYTRNSKEIQPSQYFQATLGYIQGMKIGQSFALQLSPLVHNPIFFISSVNHQPGPNLQNDLDLNENYPDTKNALQMINPYKLIEIINNGIANENKDNIRQQLKRETNNKIKSEESEESNKLRQVVSNSTNSSAESTTKVNLNTTTEKSTTPTDTFDKNTTTVSVENETTTEKQMSTIPLGNYPAANYDNSFINRVMITTEANDYLYLPPENDQRWHNFSTNSNFLKSTLNGFRPLAGLYYDGILHKNLIKKQGWSPFFN